MDAAHLNAMVNGVQAAGGLPPALNLAVTALGRTSSASALLDLRLVCTEMCACVDGMVSSVPLRVPLGGGDPAASASCAAGCHGRLGALQLLHVIPRGSDSAAASQAVVSYVASLPHAGLAAFRLFLEQRRTALDGVAAAALVTALPRLRAARIGYADASTQGWHHACAALSALRSCQQLRTLELQACTLAGVPAASAGYAAMPGAVLDAVCGLTSLDTFRCGWLLGDQDLQLLFEKLPRLAHIGCASMEPDPAHQYPRLRTLSGPACHAPFAAYAGDATAGRCLLLASALPMLSGLQSVAGCDIALCGGALARADTARVLRAALQSLSAANIDFALQLDVSALTAAPGLSCLCTDVLSSVQRLKLVCSHQLVPAAPVQTLAASMERLADLFPNAAILELRLGASGLHPATVVALVLPVLRRLPRLHTLFMDRLNAAQPERERVACLMALALGQALAATGGPTPGGGSSLRSVILASEGLNVLQACRQALEAVHLTNPLTISAEEIEVLEDD